MSISMEGGLRLHGVIAGSGANGPGNRFVVWTQGCSKGCKECFNPNTWADSGGDVRDTGSLAEEILGSGCEGLTISGGDPFEQPRALFQLLWKLHQVAGLGEVCVLGDRLPGGIIVFTGYTIEEIEQMPGPAGKFMQACLPLIDLLIDGRYVAGLKHKNTLSGSSNQRFHFSSREGRGRARVDERVSFSDFDQEAELHPGECGSVKVTGFPEYLLKGAARQLGLKVHRGD